MRGIIVFMLLFAAALVLIVGSAEAKVDGPCQASIGGADMITEDKVVVPAGSKVPYSFSAPTPIESYSMVISYAGFEIEPVSGTPSSGDVDSDQTSISGEMDLALVESIGVGLYEVQGNVILESGETCAGSILVHIDGPILEGAAGKAAAAVAGVSTLAVIGLFLKEAGFLFASV